MVQLVCYNEQLTHPKSQFTQLEFAPSSNFPIILTKFKLEIPSEQVQNGDDKAFAPKPLSPLQFVQFEDNIEHN